MTVPYLRLVYTKPEPVPIWPLLLYLETASEILLAYSKALLTIAETLREDR